MTNESAEFRKRFKNLLPSSAIFYSTKVSMEEMEKAIKLMEKQGYQDVKVVACPYWKGARE